MKSKTFRITIDLILIALGITFLVFGIKDAIKTFSKPTLEDSIKFTKSYTNVPTDNTFKYIDSISELDDKNNVILFIGSPNDVWSQVLAPTLYNITKDKYDVIYYFEYNEDVPQIVIINDSKFTYKKDDLIDLNYKGIPIEYYTQEKTIELSDKLFKN